MAQPPDDTLLSDMETFAVYIARGAGEILRGYFGRPLEVEYKDNNRLDPVTAADREAEEFLAHSIGERYPDHGILGEEGQEDKDAPAPDLVWILDPVDGTKNFLNGLPVYAWSIGVLHRGVPVVGAVWVPWPSKDGGVVFHARKGGGALMDEEPVSVSQADEPTGSSLVGLPGHFTAAYTVKKPMRMKFGEMRVAGSIAYEMAMTAKGVLHYSLIGGAHLWDLAGAHILVTESGGLAMRRRPAGWLRGLLGAVRWEPAESLVPSWQSGVTTMGQLRKWRASMVFGNPATVRFVTAHLRRRMLLRMRLARAVRRLKRGRP